MIIDTTRSNMEKQMSPLAQIARMDIGWWYYNDRIQEKERTMREQPIQKEEHTIGHGTFLLVKVGSDSRPATNSDIEDVRKNLEELGLPRLKCLVTHHNVEIQTHVFPNDRQIQ